MKKLLVLVVGAAMMSLRFALAAEYTIEAGQSEEWIGNGVDDPRNSKGNYLRLETGASVSFTNGPTTQAITVWVNIRVVDGDAYLDLTKAKGLGVDINWRGNVEFLGTGKLIVRGPNTVKYGCADHTLGSTPFLDGKGVVFEDDSGAGLSFVGDVQFRSMPPKYKIGTAGKYYYFVSLDKPLFDGDLTLATGTAGFQYVYVRTSQSLAPDAKVIVPKDCVLYIRPNASDPGSDVFTFPNDIVMDDDSLLVMSGTDSPTKLAGTVSGIGTIKVKEHNLTLTQATVPIGITVNLLSGRILSFDSSVANPKIEGILYGSDGYLPILKPVAGQTLSIYKLTGQATVDGGGTVAPQTIAKDAILRYRTGSAVTPPQGQLADGSVVEIQDCYAGGWMGTDKGVLDISQVAVIAGYPMTIRPHGPVTLRGVNDQVKVEVPADATLTVPLSDGTYDQTVYGTGGRIIACANNTWESKTALWLDASGESATRDFKPLGIYGKHTTMVVGDIVVFSNGYHLVDCWYDKVRGNTSTVAYQDRHLGDNYFHPQLYPYRVTEGLNGLDYLSFGTCRRNGLNVTMYYGPSESTESTFTAEQRRIPFRNTDHGKYNDTKNVLTRYAVMVFGSQYGGGAALLGGSNGELIRTDTRLTAPILKNQRTIYVDGEEVEGSETYFNGGWQIISIPLDAGMNVSGLGYATQGNAKDYGDNLAADGGQNYAEVLLFPEVLSDDDRVAVECYLARKWGLTESYKGEMGTAAMTVIGTGTLEANRSLKIGGSFIGPVEVADGVKLESDGGLLPPGADALPSGRVTWYDPSDETTFKRNDKAKDGDYTKEVYAVYDREKGNVAPARLITGSGPAYAGNCHDSSIDRCPTIQSVEYTPVGPMNWIDFNNYYAEPVGTKLGDKHGNTLRCVAAPNDGTSSTLSTVNIRMAFVIQNSVRGGGTPVMDTGVLSGALIGGPRTTSDFTTPIWRSGASDIIKNGKTYLDGREIDGFKNGFQGRPELFAFSTTGDFPLACFGNLNNTEGHAWGEILGESITYDRVLDDVERRQVEAYLMNKWLGTLPEGYTDLRRMSVTGAGTYSAASAAALPRFGDGFTGSLELTQDAFAFTAAKTGVTGDLVSVPAGALSLPAEVSVTVDWQKRPPAGRYPLVSAQTLSSGTTFSCSFVGGTPDSIPARFVVTETGVELEVWSPGALLLVR